MFELNFIHFVNREEGVLTDFCVDYRDNAPCIEMLTCQVMCLPLGKGKETIGQIFYQTDRQAGRQADRRR